MLHEIIPDDSSTARSDRSSRFRNAETAGHVRDLSETLNSGERFPHIQMEMPSLCVRFHVPHFFLLLPFLFSSPSFPRRFFVARRKFYVEPARYPRRDVKIIIAVCVGDSRVDRRAGKKEGSFARRPQFRVSHAECRFL